MGNLTWPWTHKRWRWPTFAQKPSDDWPIMFQLVESIDQLTASSDGAVGNSYQRTEMTMFQTFPQRAADQNLLEDKNVKILHSKKSSEVTAAQRPSLAPCLKPQNNFYLRLHLLNINVFLIKEIKNVFLMKESQNENSAIIYSPLCCFKHIWLSSISKNILIKKNMTSKFLPI